MLIRECLEIGVSPRCHLEDITRADIYGYVIPFCLELMKLIGRISDPDQGPLLRYHGIWCQLCRVL